MTTKLCRVLAYGEAKPIMKLQNSDHVIGRGHVSTWKMNKIENIFFSTRPIPPGLAKWWHGNRKPPMESHDSLTTWSFEVTSKNWNVISFLPQGWRGSTNKNKLPLNQVTTWQIKNPKLVIALLATETFNRNISIENIYFLTI